MLSDLLRTLGLSRARSQSTFQKDDSDQLQHDCCKNDTLGKMSIEILNHMLSTRCNVCKLLPFTQIGQGQCGTVLAMTGTLTVFKAANSAKQNQLRNDYDAHLRVEKAFNDAPDMFRADFKVPALTTWVSQDDVLFWKNNRQFFPSDFVPRDGIVSQKINAIPPRMREAIFDQFAPRLMQTRSQRRDFLNKREHQDCLVRLYLGRRAERNPKHEFKLRNFDLMVNEMEQLHLNTPYFARIMAYALALMHWKAGLDANDVEFVIGLTSSAQPFSTYVDRARIYGKWECHLEQDPRGPRLIGVWLLDFDQCKPFEQNVKGLQQLVRGFLFNDPYYPRITARSTPADLELWKRFKSCYLHASSELTKSEMPKQFIAAIEMECERRAKGASMFD